MSDAGVVAADARKLIGTSEADDWRLDPRRHAAELPDDAAVLRVVLQDPSVSSLLSAYTSADGAALLWQARYRRLATTAAAAGFAAVVFGTLALLAGPLGLSGDILTAASVLQAALVVTALGAGAINGWLRPYETWQAARAEAENYRIGIFEAITGAAPPQGGDARALLALQLEYFRRYQLDVQRAYYTARSRRHAAAAARARRWRLLALLLVFAGAASLLWHIRGQPWLPDVIRDWLATLPERGEIGQRLFLALGIWASALNGLLASLSLIGLDERNAARYRRTADNLDLLAGRALEDTRLSTAATDPSAGRAALTNFVALVHDQFSAEHREWIALRQIAPELSLRQLSERRHPPASPHAAAGSQSASPG